MWNANRKMRGEEPSTELEAEVRGWALRPWRRKGQRLSSEMKYDKAKRRM